MPEQKGTSNRGFASMDRAKQRAIASKGGQSVPPEKRSFSQDPQLAAQAGRKGGESVPPEGRSFSQNRELAAEAGRKGGQARGAANRGAAARRAGDFEESREVAAEGARKAGLPQGQEQPELGEASHGKDRPATRGASAGADNYGQGEELDERDELNAGNQDMQSDELGQNPAPPSDNGGKQLPHGAR